MILSIEFLIGFVILLMFLAWAAWFRLSRWILKRRYKPENDKGKLAEDARSGATEENAGRDSKGERRAESTALGYARPEPVEERGILPPAAPEPDGKAGNSTGKAVKPRGSFFSLFRRAKTRRGKSKQ